MTTLPPFRLESYFSRGKFTAKYHLTASDAQTLTIGELLAIGTDDGRAAFTELPLGYLETWGSDALRTAVAGTCLRCGPEDVLMFAGAEESLFWLLQLVAAPGEHGVVTVPNGLPGLRSAGSSAGTTRCWNGSSGTSMTPPSATPDPAGSWHAGAAQRAGHPGPQPADHRGQHPAAGRVLRRLPRSVRLVHAAGAARSRSPGTAARTASRRSAGGWWKPKGCCCFRPACTYTSDRAAVPTDRFRIGVGRRDPGPALAAPRRYLDRR